MILEHCLFKTYFLLAESKQNLPTFAIENIFYLKDLFLIGANLDDSSYLRFAFDVVDAVDVVDVVDVVDAVDFLPKTQKCNLNDISSFFVLLIFTEMPTTLESDFENKLFT